MAIGDKIKWEDADFKWEKAPTTGTPPYTWNDVRLLEEVYLEIRPWIKPHPNIGVHCDGSVCPNCGSEDIEDNGKYYTTNTNKYQSFRCNNCGALSRSIDSQLSLDARKELMRPLP